MKKLILTLLIICLVTAVALGFVSYVTAGPIAARQSAARSSAMKAVLPSDGGYYEELPFDAETNPLIRGVYSSPSSGGWVVEVAPSGFNGEILMMVGITHGPTSGVYSWEVSGISIVSMSETPDLGSHAKDAEWQTQFVGKVMSLGYGPWAVTKDGGDIDAITGATITSRAVTEGVNAAMKAVIDGSEGQEWE